MATIKKAQNGTLAKGSKPGEMSGVAISDKDVMRHPQDFQHLKSIPKYKKMLDPKGAYTKVQKRTLAGAKTKASLTKDKQLGATKMKNGGCMKCGGKMSKKK